jgi:hypothetical protein
MAETGTVTTAMDVVDEGRHVARLQVGGGNRPGHDNFLI